MKRSTSDENAIENTKEPVECILFRVPEAFVGRLQLSSKSDILRGQSKPACVQDDPFQSKNGFTSPLRGTNTREFRKRREDHVDRDRLENNSTGGKVDDHHFTSTV